jgi:hypothetical protein
MLVRLCAAKPILMKNRPPPQGGWQHPKTALVYKLRSPIYVDTSILRPGLPRRYACPLKWLPASRLLLPRSGLERSDFVLCRVARRALTSGRSQIRT